MAEQPAIMRRVPDLARFQIDAGHEPRQLPRAMNLGQAENQGWMGHGVARPDLKAEALRSFPHVDATVAADTEGLQDVGPTGGRDRFHGWSGRRLAEIF